MHTTSWIRLAGILTTLLVLTSISRSQGNLDWEQLWLIVEPSTPTGPYAWMYGTAQYTGLAYDKVSDAVYVVNPAVTGSPPVVFPTPKVYILDAKTGLLKTSIGRALNGQGGELPVPTDTVQGGYSNGQYALYKIDVDDEGRIFACNLVSPIGTSTQFKFYRWDTPSAKPKLVYQSSGEMTNFRWGDAFDVVGKRTWVSPPGVWRDSVRIFASGGVSNPAAPLNNQVNVFLGDTRTSPPYDYRLGLKGSASNTLLASHGLAATSAKANAEIWMDNNTRVTTKNNQVQTGAGFPQNYTMTLNYSISSDTIVGTGPSGAIAYVSVPNYFKTYLICADGLPSFPNDNTSVNYHTRARLIDLSLSGNESRPLGFGDTPYLGWKFFDQSGGESNFIADVDYKLDTDSITGDIYIVLYVLMSNNGIAAFRSRAPLYLFTPVEMQSFSAMRQKDGVRLDWRTASETNNSGFTIERKLGSNGPWNVLGFVAGNGTTTSQHDYSFFDGTIGLHPTARTASYRLRQTDTDGKTSLSSRVDVYFDDTPAAISLDQNFPNPCAPRTSISYSVFEPGTVRLAVYNSSGTEVRTIVNEFKDRGSYSVSVNLQSLPAGVYHYILESGNHRDRRSMVIMR